MLTLSLKDSFQLALCLGTTVSFQDGMLNIKNGDNESKFRISNIEFEHGNFWVDSVGKNILLEFYRDNGLALMLSINLGNDFEHLFPNAGSLWSDYFFKVHYST